jgi:flavin reductase (DIM6/NTAB) family NADH-FMN oxidoreductase RutF/DNA-binding GntR family transcriptional regulator
MSTTATEARRALEPNEFRDIIGRFASGVTVITTLDSGERKGTTASAFTSLSLEPPMVLVCLNSASSTGRAIAAARRFAVNILAEGQASEAMKFAGRDPDKFAGVAVVEGEHGEPLLADALATLECSVTEVVTGGTHYVFMGEVERAAARGGAPLAYFRGKFGRLELAQDEQAFADIRAHVLSREIEIGEPLDLDELGRRFGCLRSPVYHALSRLTGEGFVTRNADGAFVVRPLTLQAVQEAWRARCAIETGVAALSVGRVPESTVTELRALADAAAPAPAASFKLDSWLPAYNAFHERVVELGGSASLLDAYRRVNAPAAILSVTQRQMELQGLDREQCVTAFGHMCDLVDAYERGDRAVAAEAIRRHEEFASEVAVRFMDSQGGEI